MKASETHLQSMIEGTKQYVIPMFQRTYSWKNKQWQQLWDDIIDLADEDEHDSTHFIGSIVSIPVNATTHGVQQFLVIDGQQRLTTLLLLLAAIRDSAEEIGEEKLSGQIHNMLLINAYESGEDKYKFLPTQVDKEFFKRMINKEDLHEIENEKGSLIVDSYQFFVKKLANTTVTLSELKKIITRKLSIVSIVLSQDDNPYLVFESLNAKGQPLTQADLIRNYLFMRIPPSDQEDYYNRYWLPMQEKLGDNLTEFIRHFLLGLNINVKKNDVYVKFKEKVDKQEVETFLPHLSTLANYYAKLLYPNTETNKNIQDLLQRIHEFEANTAYPFLLYAYRDYQDEKYDENNLCEILRIIENFLVRRFVCNIDSKPLNKLFSSLYNQISTYDAKDSIAELTRYLQNRGYPKDEEVKMLLKENHLYGQGDRRKKGAYILKAIEESYLDKEKADLSKVTIEHVMPQTLTDKWMEELGDNGEYIHSIYLHTIGNLTLSAYNTELSNEPFDVKRKYYKKSNLHLNKQLSEFEKWNQDSIIERGHQLINTFIDIWPYFGKQENEVKKVTGSSPRLLVIHDESYTVKTWREVMEKTVMSLFNNDKEKYEDMIIKNSGFVSKENEGMRKSKKLPNGHYMEANLSASAIHNFCRKIFKEAGYNETDWRVEIEFK